VEHNPFLANFPLKAPTNLNRSEQFSSNIFREAKFFLQFISDKKLFEFHSKVEHKENSVFCEWHENVISSTFFCFLCDFKIIFVASL